MKNWGTKLFLGVCAKGPEGLDKASKGLAENAKTNPFAVSAFGSWVESSAHRDGLYWTSGTFK